MLLAIEIVRLIMIGIFFVAGLAKLFDLKGGVASLREFGMPKRFSSFLAVALPTIELATAFLFILPYTTELACISAAALFGSFIIAIGVALAKGAKPKCHCFGQLSSRPVSLYSIAQNIVYISFVVLLFSYFRKWPDATGWGYLARIPFNFEVVASLAALLATVGEGWAIMHMLRQNGRLMLRIDHLEQRIGQYGKKHINGLTLKVDNQLAPDWKLSRRIGGLLSLQSMLARGKGVVLVFTDPNCSPCKALLPNVIKWAEQHQEDLTLAVITRESTLREPEEEQGSEVVPVLVQKGNEIGDLYGVTGTPSAVFISRTGFIASSIATGAGAIMELLEVAVGLDARRPESALRQSTAGQGWVLPVGAKSPSIALLTETGERVIVGECSDSDILVIFWNEQCGFCKKMLPDLMRLATRTEALSSFAIAIIVNGDEAIELHKLGLGVTILFDGSGSAGRVFGVAGTPSALFIDRTGLIASKVAAGAANILELVEHRIGLWQQQTIKMEESLAIAVAET